MKKVLFVSFFHISRPGGSFRPTRLVKYLPEFGWEPVILTPSLPEKIDTGFRMIETPYRDAFGFWKKLLRFNPDKGVRSQFKDKLGVISPTSRFDAFFTFIEGLMSYPDVFRGWKPFAVKAGSKILREEKIDAMISCAPKTSHIVSAGFRKKFNVPWLADFPDLWTLNHGYPYTGLRQMLDTRLEKKTLKYADAIVTLSEPWSERMRALHQGRQVYTIPHGYDPAFYDTPAPALAPKFTITYTGFIYHKWQDVSALFGAVRELISDKTLNPDDIEIRFYGPADPFLENKIREYNLPGIAVQYGSLSQTEAIKKQRESQLLLLLGWNDPGEKGVYTTKIFEYLGARRPVIVCGGGRDVVTALMDETNAGAYVFTLPEIKQALKNFYTEYKNKGRLEYAGIESRITRYSHREMARQFAAILDKITAGRA